MAFLAASKLGFWNIAYRPLFCQGKRTEKGDDGEPGLMRALLVGIRAQLRITSESTEFVFCRHCSLKLVDNFNQ